MKTCIFITGTNCTGKTTLAKALIDRFGGVKSTTKELTICNDERVAFAGEYATRVFCGVDVLGQTKTLASIVEKALQCAEVVICEGSYLHSFGMNLTNAIFKAQRQHVICLYLPTEVLNRRLSERSGGRVKATILNKQRAALASADKLASIGVPVMRMNTATIGVEREAQVVYDIIVNTAQL